MSRWPRLLLVARALARRGGRVADDVALRERLIRAAALDLLDGGVAWGDDRKVAGKAADLAIARWRSFGRRHTARYDSPENRAWDLEKGLRAEGFGGDTFTLVWRYVEIFHTHGVVVPLRRPAHPPGARR